MLYLGKRIKQTPPALVRLAIVTDVVAFQVGIEFQWL